MEFKNCALKKYKNKIQSNLIAGFKAGYKSIQQFIESDAYSIDRNQYTLSSKNKLQILSDLLKSKAVKDLSDDQKALLKKEIEVAKSKLNSKKITNTPDKTISDKKFEVSIQHASRFIPCMAGELSKKLANEIQNEFTSNLIFQRLGTKKIICTSGDLSDALISFKQETLNRLISQFEDWEELSAYDLNLLSGRKTRAEKYESYKTLMKVVSEYLTTYINDHATTAGIIDQRLTPEFRTKFFNILKDFLILQNFDTFVDNFTYGSVVIKSTAKNDFLEIDSEKYVLKDDPFFEHSFTDGFQETNGEHVIPNLLKIAFSQIQVSEDGSHLGNQDLNDIIQKINYLYHSVDEQDLGNFNDYKTLFESRDSIERFNALLNILGSDRFIKEYGSARKANAVINFFTDYQQALANTCQGLSSFEDLEQVFRKKNIIDQFVSAITGQKEAVFVATSEKGNKVNTSVDRSASKKQIYDAIKSQAKSNFDAGLHIVYSSVWQVNPGKSGIDITDIFSANARRNLELIFGRVFTPEELEKLSESDNIIKLGQAITDIQKAYNTYLLNKDFRDEASKEAALNSFIASVQAKCVELTNLMIDTQQSQLKKILDQNGNQLPGQSIQAIGLNFEKNKQEYEKAFSDLAAANPELGQTSKNVLIANSQLVKRMPYAKNSKGTFIDHTCFRSDVEITDEAGHSVIIEHVKQEPSELLTTGLNYDYFTSIFEGNQMFLQIECYSDKPRVILYAYNVEAPINNKPFYQNSVEEIKQLWKEQYISQYRAIQADICAHWNELIPDKNFKNLSEILQYLKDTNFSKTDLKNAIKNAQKRGSKTNFVSEYDYIIENGRVSLNNSLVYKVAQINNLDEELDAGWKSFQEKLLKEKKLPFNKIFKDFAKWDNSQKNKVCYILGLVDVKGDPDLEALQVFINQQQWNAKLPNSSELSLTSQKVLYKYYVTRALFQDAELALSIKSPWIHTPKQKSNLTQDQLIQIIQNPKENLSLIEKIRHEDFKPRLIAGKKRNSSAVATFTPQTQGLRHGVPERAKVLMATFPKQIVENHFGAKDAVHPHDGASFIDGIYSEWEVQSYPGYEYTGTRKTIGLIPMFGSFTQVKHAENVLSNELLRSMSTRKNSREFNAENLTRIMKESCKLSERFIYNWHKYGERYSYAESGIYYEFNNKLAQLVNVEVTSDGHFKFDWRYADSGESVPNELIKQLCKVDTISEDGYVKIDNLYQLWNAYGGMYSRTENEYGNIVLSEISNSICAGLISWYDVPSRMFDETDTSMEENELGPMKEQVCAKLIDPEACKSGQIAVNTAEELASGDVTYGWLDTARWGIQQDYTHESLDSTIPALTQVITAIAFNGNNVPLVSNLYETLGQLISKSLQPIISKTNDPRQLNIYLAKRLAKSLQKNAVASSAQEIVLDFLQDVVSDPNAPAVFCFSNNDIFYKVSADLVASLNKDTIKQEFDGIAVIQCPSQGILQLYEDHDGKMYKAIDVARMAKKALQDQLSDDTTLWSDQDYIETYITATEEGQKLFGDVVLDNSNLDILNIGDYYYDNNLDSNHEHPILIDSPDDLRFIIDQIQRNPRRYSKTYSQQRDLGVTKITWTDPDNSKNNFFAIDSTRALSYYKDSKANEGTQLGTEKLQKLKELGCDKINIKILKKWQKANLEGLSNSTPYYFKTIGDFLSWSKLHNDTSKTFVQNLQHKAGQQVIPKVHSKFNERDLTFAEIREQGSEFFKQQIRDKYTLETSLSESEIGVTLDKAEIVYSPKDPTGEINTYTQQDLATKQFYIYDAYGNKLLQVPSNKYKGVIEQTQSGKTILRVYVNSIGPDGIVSEETFKRNVDASVRILREKSLLYGYYDAYSTEPKPKASSGLRNDLSFEENIDRLAQSMYTSWEATHYTISARIPSQSFQSFLATETVAYTEDTNVNIGYMNIWEMWFQGSDFDIDKAYTMMYSLDKSGKVAGNIFSDYSSVELLQESLNLTLPKYSRIETEVNKGKDDIADPILLAVADFKDESGNSFKSLAQIANYIENSHDKNKYKLINEIINFLNESSNNWGVSLIGFDPENNSELSTEEQAAEYVKQADAFIETKYGNFINLFNRYLNEGKTSLKNRIVQGIYTQATDLRNLESSEQPMEMKPVTSVIKKIRKSRRNLEDDDYYSEYDPYTAFIIQRANSIGKLDVGIAANGIKAAGALQQYYNILFNMSPNDFNQRQYFRDNGLRLTIRDPQSGRLITDQSFCRISNTKISKEAYKKLWDKMNPEEKANPDYVLFLFKQNADPNNKITTEALKLLKDTVKTLYSENSEAALIKLDRYAAGDFTAHESDLLETYNAYFQENDSEPETLFDLSYYGIQFEDNVADYISIFISMATDNAKELALQKIYGTPELLSIPLAMITLGVDIETTIDTCVTVLEKVHDKLSQNRYLNASHQNVRNVIASLAVKDANGQSDLDQDTVNSLLKIYDFAQELRSVTRFFKVNQGVTTKYSELKAFITTLANDRLTKAEAKYGKNARKSRTGLTQSQWESLEIPADFSMLFSNPKYAEQITQEYEYGKTCVNVMDVIQTSPHFSEQLRSTAYIVQLLENISGKAYISEQLLGVEIEETESGEIKIKNDDTNKVDTSTFRTAQDLTSAHSKILRLVDNWVLSRFLIENEQLRFSISELNNAYPNSILRKKGIHEFLRLDTENGVNDFVKFINSSIIPDLKRRFEGNFFLESLELKSVKANPNLLYYDVAFDPYAIKDNPILGANFNMAKAEFNLIKDIPLNIKTLNGQNLTVGELFYIYGSITGRGLTTSLRTITHDIGLNNKVIQTTTDDIYTKLDTLAQQAALENEKIKEARVKVLTAKKDLTDFENSNIEDNERKQALETALTEAENSLKTISETSTSRNTLKSIVKQLTPYSKAVANNGATTIKGEGNVSYNLNTTSGFISVLAPLSVKNVTVSDSDYRGVVNAIQQACPYAQVEISFGRESTVKKGSDSLKSREIIFNITIASLDGNQTYKIPEIRKILTTDSDTYRLSQGEITDLITDIIQTVNDAALYVFPAITSLQTAKLTDLVSEEKGIEVGTTIQSLLEHDLFQKNPFINDIKKWISEDTQILYTTTGGSRVRRIGDQEILIINANDFLINGDKVTQQNLLTDLYLEHLDEYNFTDRGKLLTYLQKLYPDRIISQRNLVKFIGAHAKDPQIQQSKYLQALVEKSEDRFNQTKTQIQKKLWEFEQVLKNKELYYEGVFNYSDKEESNRLNTLEEGDLCFKIDDNGQMHPYLYVGVNWLGESIFINVNKNNILEHKVVTKTFKPEEFKIAWKLLINSGVRTQPIQIKEGDYISIQTSIEEVKLGDTIHIKDKEYIIGDKQISYINKKSKTPTLIKKLVLIDLDTHEQIILKGKSNSDTNEVVYATPNNSLVIKSSENIDVEQKVVKSYSIFNDPVTIYDFEEFPDSIKLEILQKLNWGSKIQLKSQSDSVIFQGLQNSTSFMTTTGTYLISDIQEITTNDFQDIDINTITANPSYILKKESRGEEESIVPITWVPQLSEGFIESTVKGVQAGNKSITPVVWKDRKRYPKVFLEGYRKGKISISELREGDIFKSEQSQDKNFGEVVISKVLGIQKIDSDYKVTVFEKLVTNEQENNKIKICNYIFKSNQSLEIYTKDSSRFNSSTTEVPSLSQKSAKFLEDLETKTGMSIVYVNDSSLDFRARVNNDVIEINLAKTNPNEIVLEAAHEFAHIVLANLRAQNLNFYTELMYRTAEIAGDALQQYKSNSHYSDDIKAAEEYLVEQIMNKSRVKTLEEKNYQLDTLINEVFREINTFFNTGSRISSNNSENSIDSFITTKNISNSANYIDFEMMKAGNIRSDILDEISKSRKCKTV